VKHLGGRPAYIVDNPNALLIFADAVEGFWLLGDAVRITLKAAQLDPAADTQPTPVALFVARVNVPSQDALTLAFELLPFLQRHGVHPPTGQ
jgi:hypothetical protein